MVPKSVSKFDRRQKEGRSLEKGPSSRRWIGLQIAVRRSIGLDARRLDHLRPLDYLCLLVGAEVRRRHAGGQQAEALQRSWTSDVATIFMISACNLSTIGLGVAAGANSACHDPISKPF